MKRLILFFAIVFLGAGLRAASVLPVGEGKFTYKDYPPFADRPVDVHYYIPRFHLSAQSLEAGGREA